MDDGIIRGFRRRPGWLLAAAVLVLAQLGLTLRLFGADVEWARLTDDRPVLTGRHPLHLYHGWLGVSNWLERGTSSCYDPAFQAGYPKTPVFDGGCRPAEFFLLPAWGKFCPASYKIGVLLGCLLVPLAFVAAGRGYGLSPPVSVLAGLLGMSLWWAAPARGLVARGDLDVLLAGLCLITHQAWLVRYRRMPGVDSWLMLAALGTLGWWTHPLVWAAYLFFGLLYYLWVAARQELPWHVGVWGAALVGLVANGGWLWDWARYWWIRAPEGEGPGALADWSNWWPGVSEWGRLAAGHPLLTVVALLGLSGVAVMLRRKHRAPACLVLLTVAVCAALVRLAAVWPGAGGIGSDALLALVGFAACCPAALGVCRLMRRLMGGGGRALHVGAVGFVLLALLLARLGPVEDLIPGGGLGLPRLEIGLSDERRAVVAALSANTAPTARVLWEDRAHRPDDWTTLLPVWTGRPFVGGLGCDASLEHSAACLRDGRLAGLPVAEWRDGELTSYFERLNVGWVAAWNPATLARLRDYPHAREVCPLAEGGDRGALFALGRKHSFVLSGSAVWLQADRTRVALADVVPDAAGEVVLSLHHQPGWRVAPGYARAEPSKAAFDPVPLVRLRLPGPVARLTLTWENP